MLTITQAAEILGVSVVTLRRWDQAGKFQAKRDPMSGYRVYSENDVRALKKRLAGFRGLRGLKGKARASPGASKHQKR